MRIFPALLIAIALAACGQTGDLYLPNKTPPPSQDQQPKKQQTPPAATQPAPPQPN